jgi:tripartite-type tricarboxylate transporter receptor subunit TctC
MTRSVLRFVLLLSTAATFTSAAGAQPWPSKPVKAIVPISAGSAIDIVARAVSQRLQEEFKQPFVVENRPGAATTTGAAVVAGSPPDGYTILFHSAAITITPITRLKLPYDVTRDLAGIMPIVRTPLVLATTAGKYKTIQDLVAEAKSLDGAMNYATIGYGAAAHFTSERLALAAGYKAQMVSFRGSSEALTEVMTGRMAFFFTPLTPARGLIADRKLDVLATTSRRRMADLPSVPTTLEAGYKNSDFDFWVGMLVPAKTPRDIVYRLHAKTVEVTQTKAFREQMAKVGGEVIDPMKPADFDEHLKWELSRNRDIAKAAGIVAK